MRRAAGVAPSPPGAVGATHGETVSGGNAWSVGDDGQALSSDRLLLFSSVAEPGSLAKALSAGEVVCDTHEALFADLPAVRTDPRPMLVFLYSDKAEYERENAKAKFHHLQWTAGFYSDAVNELVPKSRMYVPADDAGFAGVLPTLAHELTHQWLMDRCRAFVPAKGSVRMGPRAFWIVEGFASLMEQFEYDLPGRAARLGGGDLDRVDLVASARPEQLLDWEWLAKASRREFGDLLEHAGTAIGIPSSRRRGTGYQTLPIDLFYAQLAMLCRYLYEAEGGRYRRQLLEYVSAYYRGALDQLDFAKAFGRSAKAMGPGVAEFAKAQMR